MQGTPSFFYELALRCGPASSGVTGVTNAGLTSVLRPTPPYSGRQRSFNALVRKVVVLLVRPLRDMLHR